MGVNWKTKYQYQDDVWDAVEGVLSGLGQSVLSGVLLYLSFPPVSWWPLAWVALVPMMRAHQQTLPDEAVWLALPTTTVTFLTLHFNKVSVGFALGADTLPPVARVLFKSKPNILATVFVSVALLSAFSRRFHRKTSWRYVILEPVLFWMSVDYLRDSIPVLGTSASFAYSQFKVAPVVRMASLVGSAGVTAAIVAVNASLTALLLARLRDDRGYLWKRSTPRDVKDSLVRQAKIALVIVACLMAWGSAATFVRWGSPPRVTVGLVQPGRNLTFEYDQGMYALNELTLQASMLGAKVVVWPEASFRDDPRTRGIWPEICEIAREAGCYLVVPYFTEAPAAEGTPQDKPRFINEGLFLSPSGEVLGAGAKDHPVSLLGETSVTRGRYPVFDTPYGKVGVMICYDLNFTDTARRLALNGAQIICVPSNDWQAISQAQYMYAVFRAAENGACVLKADTNYDSCIVSPDGRIVRQAVDYAGIRAVLVADVPLRSSPPPAAYLGSAPGLLSLIAWVGFTVWSQWKLKRPASSKSQLPVQSERMDGNLE
jgi:apolipoprotein N-acyltransferase